MTTITGIEPASGPAGTVVTITSDGWDSWGLSAYFGDVRARLLEATPTTVAVLVPDGLRPGKTTVEVHSTTSAGTTFAVQPSPPSVEGRVTDTPAQHAITAAWQALFTPGASNLPATLANNNPIVAVPDIDGICAAMQKCDACWDPQDPYTSAAGDASVDLASMWLQGLATIGDGGDPTFAETGGTVTFPIKLGPLGIGGAWTLTQPCASFDNDSTTSQSGGFNVTISADTYGLSATVVVDPQTGVPSVSITSMVSADGGASEQFTFSYDDGMPKWMTYITGQWVVDQELGQVVAGAVSAAFVDSILPQISYLLNAEIQALTSGSCR